MSQFRQNPISKHWVLIAPNRAKRFEDLSTRSATPQNLAEILGGCPFCPGNELMNAEVARFPDSKNWEIRIIPNKYEALSHIPRQVNSEFYISRTGSGDHEVLITRKHNEPLALQSIQTVELTMKIFRERLLDLSESRDLSYAQIFLNHGRDAGATMVHPHWQMLATPIVPSAIHDEMLGCYHYHQHAESCIYCDIMKEEMKQRTRIIFETEEFLVMAPYASRSPFETWIIPKKHDADFSKAPDRQLKQLAYVLKVTLGQLYVKLSDPSVNVYLHTLPFEHVNHIANNKKSYHWHMTVFPRLSTSVWGGFEYASGIPINPVTPEQAAEFLR